MSCVAPADLPSVSRGCKRRLCGDLRRGVCVRRRASCHRGENVRVIQKSFFLRKLCEGHFSGQLVGGVAPRMDRVSESFRPRVLAFFPVLLL